LDVRQRALYHQVHPLKLATDIATAVVSLFLLAAGHPWSALAVMFVPSILVSALFIRFYDFSKTHASQVGAYLRSYMTPAMQGVRLLGMGIAAWGAWLHGWWLVPLGTAVIVWGWSGGWLLSRFRRSA
jgi:hypothetical protein